MTTTASPAAPPATAAPALTGYHHVGLTVADIERSEAWYARTLGLVRAFVEPHGNGTGYAVVMTRPGSQFFLGLDHHGDADRQPFAARRTGLDHLGFAVPTRAALDEWVAHLDEVGADHDPLVEHTEPMPFAMVVVRDPDGIPFELICFGG